MDRATMSIWKWSALAAVVVAAVGIIWYVYVVPEEGGVCTADAMQCPDGTFVGRSGPNCEFVCPGTNNTSGELQGQVVAP